MDEFHFWLHLGSFCCSPLPCEGGCPRTPGCSEPSRRDVLRCACPGWHGHWGVPGATHPAPPSTPSLGMGNLHPLGGTTCTQGTKLSGWLIWWETSVEEGACASKPQRAGDFRYFEKPFCVSTETKQTTYHLMLCKTTRGGSSEIHIHW